VIRLSPAVLGAALALCLPVAASADFTARRDMRVSVVNDAVFEVYGRSPTSSERYWCGAADYAHRVLGAPWGARIHVVRGRGPGDSVNKRTTVQFTLDPEAAGIVPGKAPLVSLSLRVGRSQTVQRSIQDCTVPEGWF